MMANSMLLPLLVVSYLLIRFSYIRWADGNIHPPKLPMQRYEYGDFTPAYLSAVPTRPQGSRLSQPSYPSPEAHLVSHRIAAQRIDILFFLLASRDQAHRPLFFPPSKDPAVPLARRLDSRPATSPALQSPVPIFGARTRDSRAIHCGAEIQPFAWRRRVGLPAVRLAAPARPSKKGPSETKPPTALATSQGDNTLWSELPDLWLNATAHWGEGVQARTEKRTGGWVLVVPLPSCGALLSRLPLVVARPPPSHKSAQQYMRAGLWAGLASTGSQKRQETAAQNYNSAGGGKRKKGQSRAEKEKRQEKKYKVASRRPGPG